VVVTDDDGSVTSDGATLTVTDAPPVGPTITTQPQDQTVAAGETATFTVVAEGNGTLLYQWSKDGVALAGATSDTLVIENVTAEDHAGVYTVLVTDDAGSVTSDGATLTVTDAPPVGPTITTQPQDQTVAAGETATFTVVAEGNGTLLYQWSKDGGALAGATSDTLVIENVTAEDHAGVYTVLVTDDAGSVTSDGATLTVTDAPAGPTITTQPQDQTVAAGETATFTVVAEGIGTLLYQWSKDGGALAGATSDTLVIENVTAEDHAGVYTVLVTDDAGSVTSDGATLTVTDAPAGPTITTQPQDQTVAAGETATFTVVAEGIGTLLYQWSKDGAELDGATSDTLVIENVTAEDHAGVYTVLVTDDAGSVTSDGATLTVTEEPVGPTITAQPEDQTVAAGETATFTVVAEGNGTLLYQWSKDGVDIDGATSDTLVIENVTAEDHAGVYTVLVTDDDGSVTSDGATLTVTEPPAPTITTQPQDQTVVAGETATFTVVAEGNGTLLYQWSKDGAELAGATSDTLVIENVTVEEHAGVYTVLVTDDDGSVTSDGATLTVTEPPAPTITAQPEDQWVVTGTMATFTVVAEGNGTLLYQWSKDGVDIDGATSDTLVIENVTAEEHAGVYTVVVTDDDDSVTSEGATLTVLPRVARIAWVSFHAADDMPSADAVAAGFTLAPDVGYTQVLEADGHKVTRVVTSGAPDLEVLNNFDLVIISRSVPSGDYQDPPETLAWNTDLTAPTIVMGGYILRNSRLGYTTGGTIPDTTNTVNLLITDPEHPIFAGIELDEGNTMVNGYAEIVTFNEIVQRGISVNTDPIAGEGTILATIANTEDPTFGGLVIGEWQPGAVMGNAAADVLGGHRLVFLSGSREMSITSHGAGIFDLTADGTQMFLNAIDYMADPEVFIETPVIEEGNITITWYNGGTLETATEIDGEWTSTGNNTGTYTEEIGEGTMFYRVQTE
jgi:uncharacterized cupredoxin-like copper-binding protein